MKKILLFFLVSVSGFCQEDAWVFFNAKPNAQYYYDNPLQMLSQRALDRRITQNIALDIKDVPLHQPFVDQIFAANGITVLAKSKWLNCLYIRGLVTDISSLSALNFVDHIQYANHSLNARMLSSNSNHITNKWLESQVSYNYGNSNTQVQMLNVQVLHQQDYTGTGKIIAIMDSGFPGVNTTTPFQRLRDNGLILGGYDFVNNTTNPYTGYQHGTQVLSTMGGFVPGQLVGTAPNAQYYLFITEDVATETPLEESNWIEAAEMADNLGVDVINTSLGYFGYDNPAYNYSYSQMNGTTSVISRAADIAFSRGIITVTSAGNSGSSANPHIAVPADATTTLTVGAVNSARNITSFSSIGPSFDGRLKPEVVALGLSSTVANQDGNVVTSSGTSFSSPILAGAITSFWSAFPNKTNSEILQFVKQSSDFYTASNNIYGYGIPDFQKAMNLALSTPEKTKFNLNIYPNPFNNEITITSPDNFIGSKIKFYNSLGQLVLENNITNQIQKITLQNIASGVYYYNIDVNEQIIYGKLIKN